MGRHPSGKLPNQPLLLIKSRHREIMRRLIAGETQHQISVDMNITESRLSIICNSPLFKRELANLESEVKSRYINTTADVQARLNLLQPRAVEVLDELLNKKEVDGIRVSLPLKKDTALDVLELAGSGKKKNATVADAMSDVVKIISDGFKLAKELKDEQQRQMQHSNANGGNGHNGNGNGNGNGHNITPSSDLSVAASATVPEDNHTTLGGPTIVNMEETEYNISDSPATP